MVGLSHNETWLQKLNLYVCIVFVSLCCLGSLVYKLLAAKPQIDTVLIEVWLVNAPQKMLKVGN